MLVLLPHEILAVLCDNRRGQASPVFVLPKAKRRVVRGDAHVHARLPGSVIRVPLPELSLLQHGVVKANHVEVLEPSLVPAGWTVFSRGRHRPCRLGQSIELGDGKHSRDCRRPHPPCDHLPLEPLLQALGCSSTPAGVCRLAGPGDGQSAIGVRAAPREIQLPSLLRLAPGQAGTARRLGWLPGDIR